MRGPSIVERMGKRKAPVDNSAEKARSAARRGARRAKMQAQAEAAWHARMENGYYVQGHRATRKER